MQLKNTKLKELKEIRETAEKLISGASAEEIAYRKLEIERVLSDCDFFDKEALTPNVNPVLLISGYFDSFIGVEIAARQRAQWYALLVLYLLAHSNEFESEDTFLNFLRQAVIQAENYDERAKVAEFRTKAINSQVGARLSKFRHKPEEELRAVVYRAYEVAFKELLATGVRPAYDDIADKIAPLIEPYNKHPKTGDRIIGNDDPNDKKSTIHSTLVRWFGQGVKAGMLTPTRKRR